MFNTKVEVDKHVVSCLRKINSEVERNLRCLAFAKLYFKVGEYDQAVRYVTNYINAKPGSAEGQNLLGKSLEKLGKISQALEAYKTSLELDPKQNNLVIKICELMASEDTDFDQSGAQYYCEKAVSIDPNNPVIFHLKQRLISAASKDPAQVTNLLLKELEIRPTDVDIRIRLLRHLMQNKRVKDAYIHAYDIEQRYSHIFLESLAWYETLSDVLDLYKATNNVITWEFWFFYVSVLDRLTALSLNERTKAVDCLSAVLNFDQALQTALANISGCPNKQLLEEFINHYVGQVCLYFVTLIYKQAKRERVKYREANQIVLPLLFATYQFKPVQLQSVWIEHSTDVHRSLVKRWHLEACFRCAEVGHMIASQAQDRKSIVKERATQGTTALWREKTYKFLFVTREQQHKMKSSCFVNTDKLLNVQIKLPDRADLVKFSKTGQQVFPLSLHHHIWLGLNLDLSDVKCKVFPLLQYSVKSLSTCSAESLSVLDVQAFIYCAIVCAKLQLDEQKQSVLYASEKPAVLPAACMDLLGNEYQTKWLKCVAKVVSDERSKDISDVRLTLIKGIEVVRCVGNHGLDVKILIELAKAFAGRGKKSAKQSEIEYNNARAECYWKAALNLLSRYKKNQAVSYTNNNFFNYKTKEIPRADIQRFTEDGKLFIGEQLMKRKDYKAALELFENLKDPYASYHQAQIFKTMAEGSIKDNQTSEMRSQNVLLLTKARDCLYLTLDRLRNPNVDRSHPLNDTLGTEIEQIERLLSRIDPDVCANRNECDGMSDDNVSSLESDNYNFRNEVSQVHSTPFRLYIPREARPSPERLDAQLRQLAAAKDVNLSHIADELKTLRDAVSNLNISVQEIKSLKTAVEEIRGINDKLTSFKDVTEVVHELRKEINDLKKENSKTKPTTLNEEDLYGLEEELHRDFGTLSPNITGLSSTGFYPSPMGRLSAAASSLAYQGAAGLYPGYPPLYPYAGLGLPPTGVMPFATDAQMPDLRAMGAFTQGITPSMYPQPVPPPSLQNLTQPNITNSPSFGHYNTNLGPSVSATNAPVFSVGSTISFPNLSTSSSSPAITSLAAPVNVVITSSDPLPTAASTSASQILSVKIPPQHIKGNQKVHNYQIAMPANMPSISSSPSVLAQSPMPISTQGILSNVSPPMYSAVTDNTTLQNNALGLQIEKTLSSSFNKSINNTSGDLNVSNDDHDPCPDFKPIVPLPDEVPVNTGEENEDLVFKERAKLYRFCGDEWKERGVGDIKILRHKTSGKHRILMRRDQVHKICANHYLNGEMEILPMSNNPKAYIWAANDFADGETVLEKFCVKFIDAETANKFKDQFNLAKSAVVSPAQPPKTNLGGFKFTSAPTFKPAEVESKPEEPETTTPVKPSPFASFSFTSPANKPFSFSSPFTTDATKEIPKTNGLAPLTALENIVSSSIPTPSKTQTAAELSNKNNSTAEDDDFVPTAEFKPVVPLPELVEVKTGEEDCEVLFESKAKLLRFDSSTKEWKERGVGIMKILKDKYIVRLLMRREQVHKVCCNHQLLKNIEFSRMKKSQTAVSWCAKDFSEGVLNTEMFAIRFKTEETAIKFLDVLKQAQNDLDESSNLKGVGEVEVSSSQSNPSVGFGDKFKPKEGAWECQECYTSNDSKNQKCLCCEAPKDSTVPSDKDTKSTTKGVDLSTPGLTFLFGIPKSATPLIQTPVPIKVPENKSETKKEPLLSQTTGFGNLFKPQEGAWSCKDCYASNDQSNAKCACCNAPRDGDSKDSKESSESTLKGVDLSTGGLSFSFGIPKTTKQPLLPTVTSSTTDKDNSTALGGKFSIGGGDQVADSNTSGSFSFNLSTAKPNADASKAIFSFSKPSGDSGFSFLPPTSVNFTENKSKEETVFGSPHKVGFEFNPRSPRKSSTNQDEESENSLYEEEEDNIYFKPIIPLPEIVEVTTGEENEEVLYSHRAKLFRHVDGEWKERGIGDLKILLQRQLQKLRVLMRREQIHKICLNHRLTNDIKYTKKDEKTWLFSAPDFSEGKVEQCSFCLRFKNPEIAEQFMIAVKNALQQITNGVAERDTHDEDDSEVEFIGETEVTEAEKQEAIKLGLPPKFMAYRQLPHCTCEQCVKEDEQSEQKNQSAVFEKKAPTEKPKEENVFSVFAAKTQIPNFAGTPKNDAASNSLIKPSSLENNVVISTTVPTTTTHSLFGTIPSSKPFFGNSAQPFFGSAATSQSIFSNPPAQKTGTEFTGNLFGSASPKVVFGNSIFGGTPTKPVNQSKTEASVFNTSSTTTTITTAPKSLMDSEEVAFKTKSDVSFASLAANSSSTAVFGQSTNKNNENPFANLGAGAPVFGSLKQNTSEKQNKSENVSAEGANEGEYDPHYEPIVPLPDEVDVKTGEEEETVLFSERGKLYRFTNKEWKERGVGNMKVLYHPTNNTYRLLLRREMVHKIVLNQRITDDLNVIAFTMSANAWMWAGMNFDEGEHVLEKFAVKFKSAAISQNFQEAVQKAVAAVKSAPKSQNTSLDHQHEKENTDLDEAEEEEDEENEHDDEDDDEDDDENDDEYRTIMFSTEHFILSEKLPSGQWNKIAHNGLLQVIFDTELFAAKILVTLENGQIVSNTMIGTNTLMNKIEEGGIVRYVWEAVEWADDSCQRKGLSVQFEYAKDSEDFYLAYLEGVAYAEEANFVDEVPQDNDDEYEYVED